MNYYTRHSHLNTSAIGARSRLVLYIAALVILSYLTVHELGDRTLPFLDNVNLIFHEAGHTLLFFAPALISVLGGTLAQLIIPALCAIALWRERSPVSALVALWWLGQNIVNISVYASDARLQALPLLGGDTVMHDWAYLLGELHLLPYDTLIGKGLLIVGATVMLGALVLITEETWRLAKRRTKPDDIH